MSSTQEKLSPVIMVIAWLVVATPLAWGVYTSVLKSMPLFQMAGAAAPKPAQ
jgi:hypothetical protein